MDSLLSPSYQNELIKFTIGRMSNHTSDEIEAEVSKVLDEHWNRCTRYVETLKRPSEFSAVGVKRFDVGSLGNWLAIASQYTPVVGAELLGGFNPEVFVGHMAGVSTPALIDTPPSEITGRVVRFDHCGSRALKNAYTYGTPKDTTSLGWKPNGNCIEVDVDDRIVGLGMTYQYDDFIPVWHRPFIKAKQQTVSLFGGNNAEWPVEFRAFVQNGAVVGVSNYYPQISLPDEYTDVANEVQRIAQEITDGMLKQQLYPSHPRYEEHPSIESESVSATLDFILDENDSILFLEGGPAHLYNPHWGGHPCCFKPGDIHGIALKPR